MKIGARDECQRRVMNTGSVIEVGSVSKARAALAVAIALAGCATHVPATRTLRPAPIARDGSSADSHHQMLTIALSMIGQPYQFGGAAPGGFDCSGLVQYAANGAGIRLSRTAAEQSRSGTPVARDQIQTGDLIFMHVDRKELHVGMALNGETFVHAPSTGGFVRIDRLAASPYSHGYLYARRIAAAP